MAEKVINIATDFSQFPGGRFRTDGPHSGEEFRDDILAPALKSGDTVRLILDGVAGLPSSFREEAFGGLVRKYNFTPAQLSVSLKFSAETPRMRSYPEAIRRNIENAAGSNKDKSA